MAVWATRALLTYHNRPAECVSGVTLGPSQGYMCDNGPARTRVLVDLLTVAQQNAKTSRWDACFLASCWYLYLHEVRIFETSRSLTKPMEVSWQINWD